MKYRATAIILVTALVLFLMAWSFVSSAASSAGNAPPANSSEVQEATRAQGGEDEAVDADLGKFGAKIDREEYLRLRGEYFGRLRGIEPGRPFDPDMRTRAIEQMDRQEKGRKIESLISGGVAPPPRGGGASLGAPRHHKRPGVPGGKKTENGRGRG